MADRKLVVTIVGDDSSFQSALNRSTVAAQRFAGNMGRTLGGRVSVGRNFEPLLADVRRMNSQADDLTKRLGQMEDGFADAGGAAGGLSAGLGGTVTKATLAGFAISAAYQASRRLEDSLRATGDEAFTATGRLKNLGSALISGDIVGGLKALTDAPKTFRDLGISIEQVTQNYKAFQNLARAGDVFGDIGRSAIEAADAIRGAAAATDALNFSLRTTNTLASGALIPFVGRPEEGVGSPGAIAARRAAIEATGGTGVFRPSRPTQNPLGPAAKRANAIIIAQATGDLQEVLRLQVIERDARKKALEGSRLNLKEREKLAQTYASATAAVISTQRQIKAQNEAAKKAAADAAEQARQDYWNRIVGSLSLGVTRADLTTTLRDNLDALQALKGGLERQIRAGVNVADAQARLAQTQIAILTTQKEIRDRAKESIQATQFRAIGLSATGEEIVPGIPNLTKRIKGVLDRIAAGDLDVPSKLIAHLKSARRQIAKEGDALTEETRRVINEWIKAANGDDKVRHTRTFAINRNALLKGLGLDPEAERILKQRLQGFNTAGIAQARPAGAFGAFGMAFTPGGQPINITTEVVLDGQKVGRSVTKFQGARSRSNPKQKRGPVAGI